MIRTIRLFLLLAAIGLIAACSADAGGPGVATLSSQDPEDGTSPSPSAATDPNEAFLAYAECMRENGVDMPDPQTIQGGGDGGQRPAVGFRQGAAANIDDEDFAEANEECRHHLESIVTDAGPQEMTPEEEEALLAFAQCMRENGVDMPDPGQNGGTIRVGPGDADFDQETFEAAQEACEHLMPFGGEGGRGPSINVQPGGGPGTDEDQ